jgi:hypothetical protein
LRVALGAVLGYVIVAVLVMAAETIAYVLLGADGAFRPGTFEVSRQWIAVSLTISLAAAVAGGWSAAAVGGRRASTALALLVLGLGLAFAVPALTAPRRDPRPRVGNVPNTDAMRQAEQPAWVVVSTPLIGAAGVLLGARLRKS